MRKLMVCLLLVSIMLGAALINSAAALAEEASTEAPVVTVQESSGETLYPVLPPDELDEAFSSLAITQVSPPIELKDFALEDISGITVDTVQLRGQFLWLNLWTLNCGACVAELPDMQSLWEEYGDSGMFTILAVNVGDSRENLTKLAETEGRELTLPILMDKEFSVWKIYGSPYTPVNWFVDPDGYIIGMAIGARSWDSDEFHALLQAFIDGES